MTRLRDCQPVTCRRERSVGFRLTLERLPVLARHHGDKATERSIPLSELALRASAAGVVSVLLDQTAQQFAVAAIGHVRQLDQSHVALALELAELAQHERDAAAHPRT